MKRKRTSGRGRGRGEGAHNTTTQKKQYGAAQSIELEGGVATRTRRQTQIQASSLMGTLLCPLLVDCLNYLDEESIRRVCLVCKRYHALIHNHPQLKQKFIGVIEIRAVPKGCVGKRPTPMFVPNLLDRHRDTLQQYHKIQILGRIPDELLGRAFDNGMIALQNKLPGVVALDMSLPIGSSRPYKYDLICSGFSSMLPNLRELDLSNTRHRDDGFGPLRIFFRDCSCLEKLTYNHIDLLTAVTISGYRWMDCASKLKELYMDDSVFYDQRLIDRMSDLENEEHASTFLFNECTSKVLERVSIKNAKYGRDPEQQVDLPAIPQTALIKYVRNAPISLRWFCSDLSDKNITMLQHERPDIEFTN